MKILKLDLRAFGPFRDMVLDLSAGQEGLHLIYGPNEAGKSSSLRALRQMLYGIPHKSNDHFLVGDYNRLRVGGTLRNGDGSELSFLRRKGKNDLLRTPDDASTLDDASLEKFLAGVDQARFETLFSLDHDGLVKGGQAISSGGGLVGQLLFGGGSDLVRLNKLRKSLEDQHAELFNARATAKNPALNKALRDLSEERKAIEQASIRSDDWHGKRSDLEHAQTARDELSRTLDDLRRRKSKRERIAQALADVARRRELIESLATLGEAPRLRAGFSDERRRAENDLVAARRTRDSLQSELAEIARDLQELPVPGPILVEATTIENLQRKLGAYLKDEAEVARLRIERTALEQAARANLRDLGRDESLDDLAKLRLTLPQRQRIRELANDRRALIEACERTEQEIQRLTHRQTKVAASLAEIETPADIETLSATILRARREGDLAGRLEEAQRERKQRARAADLAWNNLHPKTGSRDDLIDQAVPAEAAIMTIHEALDLASREVGNLERRVKEAETSLRDVDRKLARLQLEREVPTEADLDASRRQRDQDWRTVRARWLSGTSDGTEASDADLANAYEREVVDADRVSDRLRREADRVAEKAALTAERGIAEPQLNELHSALIKAKEQHQADAERWLTLWQPLGIDPASPREMVAWRHDHTKLVEKVEAVREADGRIEALTAKIEAIRAELLRKLQGLEEAGAGDSEPVDALIDRAEQVVKQSKALATRRERLDSERRETDERLAEAKIQDVESRQRLEDWRQAWSQSLAPLDMDGDSSTEVVGAMLDRLTSLFDGADKAEAHRRRIDGFETDTAQLAAAVEALLPRVAPDLAGSSWIQAVEHLNERLTVARQAKARRDDLEKRRERHKGEAKKAETSLTESEDSLVGLAREAGCSAVSEIQDAERQSDLRQAAEDELESIHQRLRKGAAGAVLEEFLAEAQAADADALDAELTHLEEEIQRKFQEWEQANHRIGGANAELQAMEETARDARAHEAANRAQSLLAMIESKAGEYVRIRLASAVLREAIERYRERNQGPVLRRAGEYFVELTLGSFSGLRTLLNEKDEPMLVGLRPNGTTVGVEGMSEGTCDQLYLALKLASLEHHLDHNPSLPFIADDIFVNFDDERSLAGLRTLAKLAQRTQVLFFTHHRHLVEIAEASLRPDTLFVHELRNQASLK